MSTVQLGDFAKQAYLDYAMYVVLDRALPHVFDGLKPVQRRIIYVMHLLGLTSKAKYKKSTRTVGDALGKFHPHGDRACYEAMVILAQWFNTRHPLIDGQGNWGSLDNPHSFAAMRYTEARLTAFAQSYLDEIQSGGVPWVANFDGTLKEPVVLPSQLPHVLLNGAYGIAVGMTTNIPPHNCREVVDACLLLLDDPDATDDVLMQAVPGPDFPTGGECINTKESLKAMYVQGEGSLTLRATYHLEDHLFVVDQLPYRVSPTKVLTQIAEAMQQKKLPQVADLRDESDHEVSVRIVLEMKSKRTDANELAMLLFAMTDMEKQDRAIFNAISPERAPELYSLKKLLLTWLGQRKQVVVDRSKKRLEQVLDTIHILEGLLIVYLNLDDVIALIREHESPSPVLQSMFSLSERQAEAILEIKLRALSKLQDVALMQQKKELEDERDYLQGVIDDPGKLTALVKDELQVASERYQSPRRTLLVTREPASLALVQEQVLPVQNEPLTLVLSEQGWGRIAKGHVDGSGASFRVGDKLQGVYHGHSAHRVMLASVDGRFFTIGPESLPSIRSQGAPLSQFIDIGPSVRLPYVFWQENEQENVLLISNEGYGFYALYGDLLSKIKSGKQVMTGRSDDYSMLPPRLGWMNHTHLALVSTMGRMLVVLASELAYLKKGKGQKLMGLAEDDCLALCCTLNASDSIKLSAGRRTFTMKPDVWAGYVGGRGRKGKWLPKGFVQVASLEAKS